MNFIVFVNRLFNLCTAMALTAIRAKRTRYSAIEDRYEFEETLGVGK